MGMSGQEQYNAVGSPEDVVNVNPNTDTLWDSLMSDGGFLQNFMTQGNEYASLAQASSDPNAFMNAFINFAPALQGLAMDTTNPFVQATMGVSDQATNQVVGNVMQRYNQDNALYSGAATQTAIQEGGKVGQGFLQQALGSQTGLATNLLGGGMNALAGSYGNQSNVLSNLAGQQYNLGSNALGAAAGLAEYTPWQPTYMENQDYMSQADKWGIGLSALNTLFSGVKTAATAGLF